MTESGLLARWRTEPSHLDAPALPPRPWVEPNFSRRLESGIRVGDASDREIRGISRLHGLGLLEWSVGTPLIARPLSRDLPLPALTNQLADQELSEWAMLRPTQGAWVIESAAAPWQVSDERGLQVLADGPRWSAAEWALLAAIGLTSAGDDPQLSHDWNFHDRLFATRSRLDALQSPSPMNSGEMPAPPLHRVPACAANPEALRIALPVATGPRIDEPALFDAMENRRTIRKFSAASLTLADLGEVLWRSVRIREHGVSHISGGIEYENGFGPVPSGGGLHAIDIWVATSNVTGVSRAWWWYDRLEHELVMVNELSSNWAASPVAMRFTVRHARTSWKYPGFAQALELKDMGAIMLAMQLAGSPLGIGTWLFGSGSSAEFARDLGIDLTTDHPIGELALGNRRDPSSEREKA